MTVAKIEHASVNDSKAVLHAITPMFNIFADGRGWTIEYTHGGQLRGHSEAGPEGLCSPLTNFQSAVLRLTDRGGPMPAEIVPLSANAPLGLAAMHEAAMLRTAEARRKAHLESCAARGITPL
jgi:hypothetical protein